MVAGMLGENGAEQKGNMSTVLEIAQLENGDIVLREADEDQGEPLVKISFSAEVRDMLGSELISVAEAMIDAATEFLGSDPSSTSSSGREERREEGREEDAAGSPPPVIH